MLHVNIFRASDSQSEETIDNAAKETVDWTGLLSDLRDSWQSPLYYLEKRGYLPPVNENLLEQKVNELRAMKVAGESADDSGEKLEESVEDLPSAAGASAMLKTNDIIQTNAFSSGDTGALNIGEDANVNDNAAIITIASQQQPQEEGVEEALLKELTIDAQSEAEADAGAAAASDTETDPDTEEDFSSVKNNVANACRKKVASTSGAKSKLILKGIPKSKSKSHNKQKSKPGFFQRLKDKISSIFKKPTTETERKDPQIKSRPALSPDYASYYVKYLAHRDMNAESNNLSANDLNDKYAKIKDYGHLERGGTGVHRREYSGKELCSKAHSGRDATSSELIDKANYLQPLTSNDFSSTSLDSAPAVAGRKDTATLKEFPFRDFNFADFSVKQISTKEIKSNNKANEKLRDLENFNSKDEELNKIVHSLAEQQSSGKEQMNKVNIKSETKDDFSLKGLTMPKDATNELQDETKPIQKEVKDIGVKDFEPEIDMKNLNDAQMNGEDAKVFSKHNEFDEEFSMPSFSMKEADMKANGDATNKASLGNIKEFDLTIPELDFKTRSSNLKIGATKNIPNVKDFGNLGMSQLKMRILESNVEDLPFNIENEQDSNELAVSRVDLKNNGARSNLYTTRDSDGKAGVNKQISGADWPNQLTVQQTNFNGFEIGDPLTIMDKTNLDLDRQFTRQVLEKVMRRTAKKREHDYG